MSLSGIGELPSIVDQQIAILVQSCKDFPKFSCRRSGSSSSCQVRGAATVGRPRVPQRVRRDRGLGCVVLAPVHEHLSRSSASRHGRGHQRAQACSSCCATLLATVDAPWELIGVASGTYRCSPLLPAGHRIGGQAQIGQHVTHLLRDVTICDIATPWPGIEVEDEQSRCRRQAFGLDETPLRDMHFQRSLLGDPRHAFWGVDDRIDGDAGLVCDGARCQPVGRRGRRGAFRRTTACSDPIRANACG